MSGPTANAAENATQRNTGPTANTTENATQRNSGPPAAAAENAPRNTCWPTPTGPALNVISRTTDLPILSRSSYEQYDRIVVLREPKHALVPSGVRLSANEYAVGVGESVLKFYR
ncbi:uncharacterized protein LOC128551389 [Mercenaria mercenaria]|uniref:uncharacterized protein LOC128551389 n=1 Tax=Mercenaria mercenaria TaxID=6596 RepID=UPI00234E6B5A|nr:uncharacterized protein LOC128551389 [Mercenaria mercenaria]